MTNIFLKLILFVLHYEYISIYDEYVPKNKMNKDYNCCLLSIQNTIDMAMKNALQVLNYEALCNTNKIMCRWWRTHHLINSPSATC